MTDPGKNKTQDKIVLTPLAVFFHTVVNELRRRLSAEEFNELIEQCNAEREEGYTGANTKPTSG